MGVPFLFYLAVLKPNVNHLHLLIEVKGATKRVKGRHRRRIALRRLPHRPRKANSRNGNPQRTLTEPFIYNLYSISFLLNI